MLVWAIVRGCCDAAEKDYFLRKERSTRNQGIAAWLVVGGRKESASNERLASGRADWPAGRRPWENDERQLDGRSVEKRADRQRARQSRLREATPVLSEAFGLLVAHLSPSC